VDSQPDVSTVVAVAIVAFLCASFIHEGIGHGLTSVIVGARVEMIASTFCQSADNEVSRSAQRAIQASGTLANVLFGTLFWILLRGSRRASAVTRLFLWLSMLLNLLQAAGYLAVPTLMGFGDWHEFLKGLAPSWVWRGSMIGIGTLLYPAFVGLGVYELEPLLGRKLDDRRHRLRRFTLIPYLTGGIAVCASGLMSPMGRAVIAISGAAATFGGASGLVWLPSWSMGRGADTRTPDGPPALTRSIAWQMLGAAGLVVLVYVLGRGIRFEP
jgi:hypothetical protein